DRAWKTPGQLHVAIGGAGVYDLSPRCRGKPRNKAWPPQSTDRAWSLPLSRLGIRAADAGAAVAYPASRGFGVCIPGTSRYSRIGARHDPYGPCRAAVALTARRVAQTDRLCSRLWTSEPDRAAAFAAWELERSRSLASLHS